MSFCPNGSHELENTMQIKDLTQEQVAWFRESFACTKNQELADRLGASTRCVTRMARELGLWKTAEFMTATQRNASEHGARVNRARGGNAGAKNLLIYGVATRYKAGENIRDRMSAEELDAMYRKISATRKELFRKERRRVLYGLDQKTDLRVVRCPIEKIRLRCNLRKHGYEIPRASNEATITSDTRRNARMEARAKIFGIVFNEKKTMKELIIEMSKGGYAVEDIAEELGLSETYVFDVLSEAGEL